MEYQISLSGGMGSTVTALAAHYYGLQYQLVFADTLIEDSDLYRFLIDTVSVCEGFSRQFHRHLSGMLAKVPEAERDLPCRREKLADLATEICGDAERFVWLQDGRTPWEVYADVRFIGNTRKAQCSTKLKGNPVSQHVQYWSEPTDPLVLGMDIGEQDRIDRAARRWAPRPVVSLLNQYRIPKTDYGKWLDYYGIGRPRLYDYGFSHNNCGGFCCKAGQKQFANLYHSMPERYRWHEEQMEQTMAAIGYTAKPFLREVVNGETQYMTLKEYRGQLEDDLFVAPEYGEEGCGCFTDD